MISAFGPRARAFADRLGDIDAVIADERLVMGAFPEAVRRRQAGETFYGMVLIEDRRTRAVFNVAPGVLTTIDDLDQRRVTLEHLPTGELPVNGEPASALWADDPSEAMAVREFLSLADVVLVRSHADRALLETMLLRPKPFEIAVSEPVVPVVTRVRPERPSVVVWAPDRAFDFIAWHAFALTEFRGDVTCVCLPSAIPAGLTARFARAGDPAVAEALARANVILCPEPHDPGPAIAFARQGYGIVAPAASGVPEFVRDAATYDFSLKHIPVAVAIALTRPASVRYVPPPLPAARSTGFALPAPAERPLVSVIVPTYNRPNDVALCLANLERQTYRPLEVVVMNDAGENVDAIVARFPFARAVNLEQNGGAVHALVAGFAHVRGTYVQLLADDDELYPDHIERLMAAILASGAAIAHGNSLIRYQQRRDDGTLLTVGFNAQTFADSTTPTEALKATPISGQAFVIRRDITDEIGGFRVDCVLADQEFQLRASDRYAFAYVDQTTAEWRVRGRENFSSNVDTYAAVKQVFEEMHPRPDRPVIEFERKAMLDGVAARPKGFIFPPTIQLRSMPVETGA